MKREIIKIEFDNRQYEIYARATILEEQMIRERAAEFTAGGLAKLIELESLRNSHLDKCLLRDDSGNTVKGENDESIKVDVKSTDFRMYAEYQRILDNAYFYGILKTLIVNIPDGFDAGTLEGIKFYGLKSAFEDALDSFRGKERNAEARENSQRDPHTSEPPAV